MTLNSGFYPEWRSQFETLESRELSCTAPCATLYVIVLNYYSPKRGSKISRLIQTRAIFLSKNFHIFLY